MIVTGLSTHPVADLPCLGMTEKMRRLTMSDIYQVIVGNTLGKPWKSFGEISGKCRGKLGIF